MSVGIRNAYLYLRERVYVSCVRVHVYSSMCLDSYLYPFLVLPHAQTNDLANVTIRAAHTKSIRDIALELQGTARELRDGKNADFEKSKPLMKSLPTWLLSLVVKYVTV